MTQRLIIFGSGGHAKVVLEAIQAAEPGIQIAILDDHAEVGEKSLLGLPVIGSRHWLAQEWPGVPVCVAIGSNAARYQLMEWLTAAGRPLATVIHPAATLSASASVGAGCFLAAGAVINAEASLGAGVIVNTGASVDHESRIGIAAHIAPGARLCGGVQVGARTLVGTGACVIPGIRVGADAIIGAASAVISDVPDRGRFAGAPARSLR